MHALNPRQRYRAFVEGRWQQASFPINLLDLRLESVKIKTACSMTTRRIQLTAIVYTQDRRSAVGSVAAVSDELLDVGVLIVRK